MGLVTRKTKPWLEAWNFQPYPAFSREGRGAGNGINNWSCLHYEASIGIPTLQDLERFQVAKHAEVLGEGMEAPQPFPYTLFCASSPPGCSPVSFIIAVPSLFGTRDGFCGRQFLHRPWVPGMVLGGSKHITFKLTSCCVARFLIGQDQYWSVAWKLGTSDPKISLFGRLSNPFPSSVVTWYNTFIRNG